MHMNAYQKPVATEHTKAGIGTAARPGMAPPIDEAMQAFNAACINLSEASAIRLRAEEAEQRAMAKALAVDPFLTDAKRCLLIQRAEQHADNAAAAADDRARKTDLLRRFFPT